METIVVTEHATFARVKLGDIKPNRFRNLDRWPLEQEVLDKLKQSIHETGFWNNLQAIENERGEIELRFGHHRLAAGLELFGPEYEAAIEIVPYRGEWNLQRALLMENSIGRNKIMHTHEIVYQLMHWWDDVVFEKYPTWFECIESEDQAVKFNRLDLEAYFGKQDENGPGHYSQSVNYGIGHEVIAKMLAGAEKQSDIKEALAALEPTARRKRGMELKAAEERATAEKERAEAERIKEELEAKQRQAIQERRDREAELERIAREQSRLEGEARKAKEQELEAKKQAAREFHDRVQREHRERQAKIAESESKARQADTRASQQEQALERREWYDAKASEVFGLPSHGTAFRQAVSNEKVRPFIQTAELVPFAQAIRAELELRSKELGRDLLTASNIMALVNENFQSFRQGIKRLEKLSRQKQETMDPVVKLARLYEEWEAAVEEATHKFDALIIEFRDLNMNEMDESMIGGPRRVRTLRRLESSLAEFKQFFQQYRGKPHV